MINEKKSHKGAFLAFGCAAAVLILVILLENLNLAGVPFPAKIKELLGHKAEEMNKTDDETGGDADA